jgi:hypothetical protein
LMKHINDPLPMPRKVIPTIPEQFERVALKALAKNADDRFQTAIAMTEALASAAQESGILVPASISLPHPLGNSTNSSPAVGVFSGKARQQIRDASFASGDTDITTGTKPNSPTTLNRVFQKVKTIFQAPIGLTEVHRKSVRRAVLSSVTGIVIGNMLMIWLGGILGWNVFGHIWPIELILVGVLLLALMSSLPNPWLFIPAGIVLGNGFLFSYFALSGQWQNWTILWPLEPLLIAGCIITPFLLNHRGPTGLWLTRRSGNILLILAVIVFIITLVVAILLR